VPPVLIPAGAVLPTLRAQRSRDQPEAPVHVGVIDIHEAAAREMVRRP